MMKFIIMVLCIVWVAKNPDVVIMIVSLLVKLSFATFSLVALLLCKAISLFTRAVVKGFHIFW